MTSQIDPDLLQRYRETDYIISDDPPLLMKVGEQNDGIRILLASFSVESGAFITACNPRSRTLTDEENTDRQMDLLAAIEELRLNYLVGVGEGEDWQEYSYFVLGATRGVATELADSFEQNAYVFVNMSGVPELITLR